MTTPHPLAEFIHAFADGKKVQFERPDMGWINCTTLLDFSSYSDCKWRFKPDTIVVNGVEVPKEATDNADSRFAVDIECRWNRSNLRLWYPSEDVAKKVFDALCKPFKEST